MNGRDLGLLALRVGIGGAVAAHGAQKLFGWFGGAGLERTGATFERLGFRPGKLNAIAAGLGEAGGGALLAVGLGTPGAAAAVAGTMIVAASMHVNKGFFNSKGGFEYPAVLGWSAAALALTGPGTLSLDHVLAHRLNRSWMRSLALAAAAPVALAVIARRRRRVATGPTAQGERIADTHRAHRLLLGTRQRNLGGLGMKTVNESGRTVTTADPGQATVSLRQTNLGNILVGAEGRTLYLFTSDKDANSTCYEDCAKYWPPLTTSGKPLGDDGIDATKLGVSARTDGTTMVTFNGHPLYYFIKDSNAGDVAGQGIGNEWYVLDANGNAITS